MAKARPRRPENPLPPLDPQALQAIAVRYVERFQTSRARLLRLLQQKIRQRGWGEGLAPPDLEGVADHMVALGYIDDAAFAAARARGLARRGMGEGRVRAALSAHGVDPDVQAAALEDHDAVSAALAFARRKRLGPYGPAPADPKARSRQMAAMARAGHPMDLARRILAARSEDELPQPAEDA